MECFRNIISLCHSRMNLTVRFKKNGKLEKENIIQNVEVFDVYTGEHVEKGSKSIALSIVFQSAQRTLKDADINEIHNRILETLEKDLHAQLRA